MNEWMNDCDLVKGFCPEGTIVITNNQTGTYLIYESNRCLFDIWIKQVLIWYLNQTGSYLIYESKFARDIFYKQNSNWKKETCALFF